jgi:hypothetical protein
MHLWCRFPSLLLVIERGRESGVQVGQSWTGNTRILADCVYAAGEYGDGEYGDGEYGDGEYGDGERGAGEAGAGEAGAGEAGAECDVYIWIYSVVQVGL